MRWGPHDFCRVTALAFLRHITNPRIMGPAALDGAGAWRALETWLAVPGIVMRDEPAGLDEWLRRWSGRGLAPRAEGREPN